MSKVLSYRPDIDTLRAVAVLSVVVFHIEKNWLPGGFLGVDIFFVISGFLITMIIHREMSSGVFSFKKFYIRRIKRILPAFFTVLTVTLVCGFLLFTKDDFFLLWRTALSTLGFISNIFFAKGQGYFDPIQEEKTFASHLVFIGRRAILFRLPDIAVTGCPQKLAHSVCLPHHAMRIQHFGFFYTDCTG